MRREDRSNQSNSRVHSFYTTCYEADPVMGHLGSRCRPHRSTGSYIGSGVRRNAVKIWVKSNMVQYITISASGDETDDVSSR